MWSKFAKNSILLGPADAYCLVCETPLRTEENATNHVDKPVHKKKLDAVGYFEKYKNDYIKKIKNRYFCQFCNVLLPTAAQVGLHVAEAKHKENKNILLVKRVGNDILIFNDVLIKEDAWNGLLEDTCVLCNTEYEDKNIHKTKETHILNLVQNKLIFGDKKSVYRKIDENSYQCLTCNNVFSPDSFTEHFSSTDHENAYKKCDTSDDISDSINKTNPSINKTNPSINKTNPSINKTNPSINKTNSSIKKNNSSIKEINSSMNKTNPSINKTNSIHKINPSEANKVEKKPNDNSKAAPNINERDTDIDDEYMEVAGAKNYVAQHGNGQFHCILCRIVLTAPNEHINSKHHKSILKLHKERIAMKKLEEQKTAAKIVEENKKAANEEPDDQNKTKSNEVSAERNIKILDSVAEFQKNEVNIDFISDKAYCKKCSTTVDFDLDTIRKHIEDHKKIKNVNAKIELKSGADGNVKNSLYTKPVFIEQNKEVSTANIESISKEHNLSYEVGESKVYCLICSTHMPAAVKNITEHVNGTQHKAKASEALKLANISTPIKLTKVPITVFVKDATGVNDEDVKDLVINEELCINMFSFLLIGKTWDKIGCLCCNIQLHPSLLGLHVDSQSHKNMLEQSQVITNLKSEFIREIKPDEFHCGFCNRLEHDWESMEDHLTTEDHKRHKRAAEWRLQEHLPDIHAHHRRQQMEFEFVMRMLMSNFMPI